MDRIVMITGSSRGIGYATAAEFLKAGDRLVLSCRHEDHVEEAKKSLAALAAHDGILDLVGDVRKEADVERMVARCLQQYGRIDVLVNNAGTGVVKPIEEMQEWEWDLILDTNLKGPFLFMRQVIPIMKKQGKGVIVNIASRLGVVGVANLSAYCASKFGLIGLTQAAASETAGKGVKIYAVLPAGVNTQLLRAGDLNLDPAKLMTPEHVAQRIFKLAEGVEKSGQSLEIYS
jgi:NAD(P)-dependent dehydrogenase (short-subunit alcohol dehydrogenase family)